MRLNFDYYHNLERTELYLCNPDGRELFPISCVNRNVALRFNDLSELTFDIYETVTTQEGKTMHLEAYDYIETKRLIFATNIGWFQITGVSEKDDGEASYKSVTAESYQTVLKNKGFISEERVYCFYNPSDPYDDKYTALNSSDDESVRASAIPSVVGQLKRQLGIQHDLEQGLHEPEAAYDDWTITYINSGLIFSENDGVCRTFKESTTYGYDWIVNDVEEAFEVVVIFDFLYKTIHIMTPEEVAQKTNVVYSFSNFMNSVEVNEDAEDIVTVLNCNGDNCDITGVNPTGTNYICDFSYYMDEVNHRWMSQPLIDKLKLWKEDCLSNKERYMNTVEDLRVAWVERTGYDEKLQENSLRLKDLKEAASKRMSPKSSYEGGGLMGVVLAEKVDTGNRSISDSSDFYNTDFSGGSLIRAYKEQPEYSSTYYLWEFSGDYIEDTADNIVSRNHESGNELSGQYLYFMDGYTDRSCYCKLRERAIVGSDGQDVSYACAGFDKYISYGYPETSSNGTIIYVDGLQKWINTREAMVNELNRNISAAQSTIDTLTGALDEISSRLNIISYFSSTPDLLRELNCYWVEGDYTNENIAVLEETTPAEEIELSNQLMEASEKELSKVCQPRFSFSLESSNALGQYEFRSQMRELELGKIITIEKEDGVWYYPALLEISMSLDNSDSFSMTFANAMRLDDWGYTYADLISDASSTSRQVSACWQDLTSYAKNKGEISSLIKNPLDTTLRASFANMVNQEFAVDSSGILGRKKIGENSDDFEPEQVRMLNNVLIFTDDGWETSKTALGKIYYEDEDGRQVSSYGLLAETIIGSLIMGEKMSIINENSSIQLDGSGLRIIKKKEDGESEDTVVFEARTDGVISVRGYALQSVVEDKDAENKTLIEQNANAITAQASSINGLSSRIDVMADNISAKVSSSGGQDGFGWSLVDDGFTLRATVDNSEKTVFAADKNGVTMTGNANIIGGSLNIGNNFIVDTSGNVQLNGNVTWGADSSPTKAVYASSNTTTPPDGSGWHETFTDGDLYASYSHDGGATWTDAVRIVGEKGATGDRGPRGERGLPGEPGADGSDGSDATVNYKNVFDALTNNGGIKGIFDGTSGELYINANYINSGEISAGLIKAVSGATLSSCTINGDCTIYGKLNGASGTFSGNLTSNTIQFGSSGELSTSGDGFTMKAGNGGIVYTVNKQATISSGDGAHVSAQGSVVDVSASANLLVSSGNLDLNSTSASFSLGTGTFSVSSSNFSINPTSVDLFFSYDIDIGDEDTNGASIYIGGGSGHLYGDWKADSGATVTSDKEKKNSISTISSSYTDIFDQLKPVTFKYNDGTSDRLHTGFIAQDVEQAVLDAGLTTKEFAAICYDINEDGNKTNYGIRYSELVALLVKEVQSLKAEVKALKDGQHEEL